jgi:hypothetical protein
VALEELVLQGLLARKPVFRGPLEQLLEQVGSRTLVPVVQLARQDRLEVSLGHVVEPVDELNRFRCHLGAHVLQLLLLRQAQDGHLLNQLAALRLAREEWAQCQKFRKDAANRYIKFNFLRAYPRCRSCWCSPSRPGSAPALGSISRRCRAC